MDKNFRMNAARTLAKFRGQPIGVLGDLMLDHSIAGVVERISQEAPTPIVRVTGDSYMAGGAANVAVNVASLGGAVTLLGVLGKDVAGARLLTALRRRGVDARECIASSRWRTIEKIRVLSLGQQMLRLDREEETYLDPRGEEALLAALRKRIDGLRALIVADYAKGTITPKVAAAAGALARARKIPLVVDTKPKHFPFYRSAFVMTPNTKEAEGASGRKIETSADLRVVAELLARRTRAAILVKRGAEGMSLFAGGRLRHIPSVAREVFDVTGAGDTAVAAFALGVAAGADLYRAAWLANQAAGVVVGKRGTASVSQAELLAAVQAA